MRCKDINSWLLITTARAEMGIRGLISANQKGSGDLATSGLVPTAPVIS